MIWLFYELNYQISHLRKYYHGRQRRKFRRRVVQLLSTFSIPLIIPMCVGVWNMSLWNHYTSSNQEAYTAATPSILWARIRHTLHLDYKVNDPEIQRYIQQLSKDKVAFYKLSERAAPFLYYIVEETEKRHLPGELALLPMIESAFEPTAVSQRGAAGLWQMMPHTGKRNGLKQDSWYDGRKDVAASTIAALDYLEFLYKAFDNNWELALAAYNAGEGSVQKAIQKVTARKKNPYLKNLDLPTETKTFVPKLYAMVELIKNAKKYALVLPIIDNKPYFTHVDAGRQMPLQTAAKLAGLPVQTIKKLNPAYKKGTTHPKGPHQLLLPLTHARRFENNLEKTIPLKNTNV